MSATFTYAQLKAALQGWEEDFGTKYVGQLDTLIGLGELRMLRDLDLDIFDQTDSLVIASGGTLDKPDGFLDARSIGYKSVVTGKWVNIEPRTREYLLDYSGSGEPLYYSNFNEARLIFRPTPLAASFTVNFRYIKRPAGLSTAVVTTWLSTHAGDALLYACLAASELFLKGDERVAAWEAQYKDRLAVAKVEVMKQVRVEYGR